MGDDAAIKSETGDGSKNGTKEVENADAGAEPAQAEGNGDTKQKDAGGAADEASKADEDGVRGRVAWWVGTCCCFSTTFPVLRLVKLSCLCAPKCDEGRASAMARSTRFTWTCSATGNSLAW